MSFPIYQPTPFPCRVCREQVYLNGHPAYTFSSNQSRANDDIGATLVAPRGVGSLSSECGPPGQKCAVAHPPPPPPPFPRPPVTVEAGDPDNIEKNAGSKNACGAGVLGGEACGADVSTEEPTSAASTAAAAEKKGGPRAMAGVTCNAPRNNITTSPSGNIKSSPATETPRKRYKHPAGEVLATSAREYLACPAGGELSIEFRILDSSTSSMPGRGAKEVEERALGAGPWGARVDEHISHFGGIEGEGGMSWASPDAQGFLEIHKL